MDRQEENRDATTPRAAYTATSEPLRRGSIHRAGGDRAAAEAADVASLAELYDDYAAILYPLLLSLLRDTAEAQDVLQETFIQAWRNQASFDAQRGNVVAWLVAIARSRAIDRLRSRTRRSIREEEAGGEIFRASSNVDLTDAAEINEMRRAVRHALEELPDEQRTVLQLAYFDGLSQSEIAEWLGQPLGTVKTRIRLAMKKLRGLLKQWTV